MAAVPITIYCMVYPRDKSHEPYPATIQGFAHITGLGVGGGPIEPPPDIQPEPPLQIWGPPDMPPGFWGGSLGPGVKPQPKPEHPIVLPPDPPPEQPPTQVEKPHEGWNWSAAKSGWYFLYVPREGSAEPKRAR